MWGRAGFQDILRPVSRLLESLHDLVMVWLMVVLVLVIFIRSKVILRLKRRLFPDSLTLEVIWTVLPIFILLLIAFPRLQLLCIQDSLNRSPMVSLKVISNQWNWQRERCETFDHLLDSETIDLVRSFETPISILRGGEVRVLTVRTDVLHSLGLPRLTIKLDTSPGRIRATVIERKSQGLLLGSCYELCGRGHSAIPFTLLVI